MKLHLTVKLNVVLGPGTFRQTLNITLRFKRRILSRPCTQQPWWQQYDAGEPSVSLSASRHVVNCNHNDYRSSPAGGRVELSAFALCATSPKFQSRPLAPTHRLNHRFSVGLSPIRFKHWMQTANALSGAVLLLYNRAPFVARGTDAHTNVIARTSQRKPIGQWWIDTTESEWLCPRYTPRTFSCSVLCGCTGIHHGALHLINQHAAQNSSASSVL